MFSARRPIFWFLPIQRRWIFLGLLLMSSCGGGNTGVTSEQTAILLQAQVQARIFSSVPAGGGTQSCPTTCEFSYTAGSSGVLKAHEEFPSLNFKCDANGVPETGQGFDATFMVDPLDEQNRDGGTLEASCGPAGASIVDQLTLSIFSASLDVNISSCKSQTSCELPLIEMSSLNDRIRQSGLQALLSSLQCPTLDFLLSFCTGTSTDNSEEVSLGLTCSLIVAAKFNLDCDFHGCGDNQVEGGEECDGTDISRCAPGEVCNKQCQCLATVCGNGKCEVGESQSCPTDCLVPPPGPCVEDGLCDVKSGENHANCPKDCFCGDNSVDPTTEICDGTAPGQCALQPGTVCSPTCDACLAVTPVCGDGVRSGKELCDTGGGAPDTCTTGVCLPDICRCCGDGICDSPFGEDETNCPGDCANHCGNGVLDSGEQCDPGLPPSCGPGFTCLGPPGKDQCTCSPST